MGTRSTEMRRARAPQNRLGERAAARWRPAAPTYSARGAGTGVAKILPDRRHRAPRPLV